MYNGKMAKSDEISYDNLHLIASFRYFFVNIYLRYLYTDIP